MSVWTPLPVPLSQPAPQPGAGLESVPPEGGRGPVSLRPKNFLTPAVTGAQRYILLLVRPLWFTKDCHARSQKKASIPLAANILGKGMYG